MASTGFSSWLLTNLIKGTSNKKPIKKIDMILSAASTKTIGRLVSYFFLKFK
jgi:hypothetical protein